MKRGIGGFVLQIIEQHSRFLFVTHIQQSKLMFNMTHPRLEVTVFLWVVRHRSSNRAVKVNHCYFFCDCSGSVTARSTCLHDTWLLSIRSGSTWAWSLGARAWAGGSALRAYTLLTSQPNWRFRRRTKIWHFDLSRAVIVFVALSVCAWLESGRNSVNLRLVRTWLWWGFELYSSQAVTALICDFNELNFPRYRVRVVRWLRVRQWHS